MPTGKLIDPGGGAQAKKENGLGSILGTDGKCYPFKNDAPNGKLKPGVPIVFYTEPAKIDLLKGVNIKYDIAVAYLHLDEFKKPHLIKSKWDSFETLWYDEWEDVEEENIKKLGLEDKYKDEYGDSKEKFKKFKKFAHVDSGNPNKKGD